MLGQDLPGPQKRHCAELHPGMLHVGLPGNSGDSDGKSEPVIVINFALHLLGNFGSDFSVQTGDGYQ